MLFNSFAFLLFFPLVAVIYFVLPSLRWRNLFLLAASYYFYMNWEPVYALLLLTSTGLTYLAGLGIAHFRTPRARRGCLWGSVVLNLLILFFFKYYAFAAENVEALMQALGIAMHVPEFRVLLPVGISFYTFQALGYAIDVYRGDTRAERNFFTYALFVSFFPQLVAGPIERSTNLLRQFYVKHRFDADEMLAGVKVMLWGYFLKLVLADRCAIYVDAVYNHIAGHEDYSTLVASLLFPFQLYGDFAGYTFIAIGCARVMGFRLMDNFRRPYLFSTSIQDYWKRNHISLTTWFMDYVYYPLTERRNSLQWWCCAIFITFLVSGLWHGAAWTFVVWGALHGALLVGEMLTGKRRKRWEKRHALQHNARYAWGQRLVTFAVLVCTLVFFRANTLGDAFEAFKLMVSPADFSLAAGLADVMRALIAIGIVFVKEYREEFALRSPFAERNPYFCDGLYLTGLGILLLLIGVYDGGQFIYFQF